MNLNAEIVFYTLRFKNFAKDKTPPVFILICAAEWIKTKNWGHFVLRRKFHFHKLPDVRKLSYQDTCSKQVPNSKTRQSKNLVNLQLR